MTPEQFELILRRVLDNGVSLDTTAYVGMILALLAGTVIGAFLGAYAKRKGENRAMKEDLAPIVDQLKQTTAAAEETKAAVLRVDRIQHDRWMLKRDTYIALVRTLTHVGRASRSLSGVMERNRKAGMAPNTPNIPKPMTDDVYKSFAELADLIATSTLFCSKETVGILFALGKRIEIIAATAIKDKDSDTEKLFGELSQEAEKAKVFLINDARHDLFGDATIQLEVDL